MKELTSIFFNNISDKTGESADEFRVENISLNSVKDRIFVRGYIENIWSLHDSPECIRSTFPLSLSSVSFVFLLHQYTSNNSKKSNTKHKPNDTTMTQELYFVIASFTIKNMY